MTEPTDAEKILLKVVDLQAKHMDNSLSMFLYSIDSRELCAAQKDAYIRSILGYLGSGSIPTLPEAFEEGWKACWQALCTIAETQGGEKPPQLDLIAATHWEIAGVVCPKCRSNATNFTPACTDDGRAVYLLLCVACYHQWWDYDKEANG